MPTWTWRIAPTARGPFLCLCLFFFFSFLLLLFCCGGGRTCGNTHMRKFDTCGNTGMRKSAHAEIRACGNTGMRKYAHAQVGTCGNTDMRKSAHAQVGTCSMFSHMLHAASRTHAARRDQRKCILFCFYSFFFVVYNTQGATGRRASG